MATPSITSVTPSVAPTGGGVLLEIRGAGFALATPLATSGPTARPAPTVIPTVIVRVGGRAAGGVRVLAPDRLACTVPSGDAGPADVVVQNVDAAGAPISEEEAVARGALTYIRPALTAEADLTRLVRALIQELKRQVLEHVVLTVHTDFDAEVGAELHLAQIAQLPGLVLIGPELPENRFFSLNQRPEVSTGPGQFAQRRAPYTIDLAFTLIGVSDHTTELLNLMGATALFFHRNKYLEMDRDPTDPDAGRVHYEMDIAQDGGFKATSQPNESNLRSFSGRFVVRGFDLEDLAGFPGEGVVARGAVAGDVGIEAPQPLGTNRASGEPRT